jgi:hypothetical protein
MIRRFSEPTPRSILRDAGDPLPNLKGDGHVTLLPSNYFPSPELKGGTGMARSAQYMMEKIKEELGDLTP